MLGRGPSLHHKNIIGLNGLWIALASPAMTQMSQRQRRLVLLCLLAVCFNETATRKAPRGRALSALLSVPVSMRPRRARRRGREGAAGRLARKGNHHLCFNETAT